MRRRAKLNKSQVKTVPLNKHPSFPAPSSSSNSSFLNNSSSSSFLTLPRNTRKNGGPVVPSYDGTGSKEISIIGQLRNSSFESLLPYSQMLSTSAHSIGLMRCNMEIHEFQHQTRISPEVYAIFQNG